MESLVHAMLSNALAATVLAVVVAVLGRTCRRPAVIHGLGLVVLIKLITPPLVPVSLPIPAAVVLAQKHVANSQLEEDSTPAAPVETRPDLKACADGESRLDNYRPLTGPAGPNSNLRDLEEGGDRTRFVDPPSEKPSVALILPAAWKWEHLVLCLILAGALGWWTLATVRIVRFQRMLRDMQSVPEEWQYRTDDLAERLGLGRRPAVCLVPGRIPPMLWAIGGRPRLLVPSQLWSTMSSDERTSLLLHELAHLRRRDHWVRWLELIVAGLYWWLPTAWWIRRLLREAEEQCCDAWVVWAMPRGAKTYATALLAALEFVSGARTTPAAASATSGTGHVSCLKRRLRMIMRAKTPKGLSWAGRLAVMGAAALLLPLAPSWAQKDHPESTPARRDRPVTTDDSHVTAALALAQNRDQPEPQASKTDALGALLEQLETLIEQGFNSKNLKSDEQLEDRIAEEFQKDSDVVRLTRELQEAKNRLDRAKAVARSENDPARRAAEKQHKRMTEQYTALLNSKYDELRARLTRDDAKDDDKDDKGQDGAEQLEEHVKDLIGKLGKELGPVGEEIRKALEQAVREVHQSLEKEGVSVEDLGRALEKARADLQRAIEKGGPVNEEMRKAIERSREDLERAHDDVRKTTRDRLESALERSRDLARAGRGNNERRQEAQTDRERGNEARSERDHPRAEQEKGTAKDREGQPNREDLDTARKEVQELRQQLSRATRRLQALQRREMESRRKQSPRREQGPRSETTPQDRLDAPREETAPMPRPLVRPVPPAAPARPEQPNVRRGQLPNRPDAPSGQRRAAQPDNERRLRQLEDKMNQLLRELKDLKGEKPSASDESSAHSTRSLKPNAAVPF